MPMSGRITSDSCPDDIQVLSSELIVVEDSLEDDVARTGQKLAQSKFLQTMETAANLGVKTLFRRKADKTN